MAEGTVQVKQPYEAPAVVELGSFNTETTYAEWGNAVEIGIPKVYYTAGI